MPELASTTKSTRLRVIPIAVSIAAFAVLATLGFGVVVTSIGSGVAYIVADAMTRPKPTGSGRAVP